MIRRLATLMILSLACALPLRGEEVVVGLSQNRISITAGFDGSEILVFGAIRREAPPDPQATPLGVVVTIEGPSQPVTVRRKDRIAGIWVNAHEARLRAAPSFYAVATTGPLDDVLSATEDLRHRITVGRAIRAIGLATMELDRALFIDALIRIRSDEELYQELPGAVSLERDTLFRTAITLPANLTEGRYATRIFLTRDGEVIDQYHTAIEVGKVGLERWLFTLAHDRPLAYGMLALTLALVAGWAASVAFRYLRP